MGSIHTPIREAKMKLIPLAVLTFFLTGSALAQTPPAPPDVPTDLQTAASHVQALTTLTNDVVINFNTMSREILSLRQEVARLKATPTPAQAQPTPAPPPNPHP